MNFFYLYVVLMFAVPALGQDLQQKVKTLASPYSKEVFGVNKTNKEVKEGAYLKYFYTGVLAEKGQYAANEKVGMWEFYSRKGDVEQKYNFTDKKVEFTQPIANISNYWVEENGNYIEKSPDELPVFIGGNTAFGGASASPLRYPAEALRRGIQGTVLLSAVITATGQMVDEKIEKGVGYGLEEAALDVIKATPGEWVPGKVNGTYVNTKIFLPIRFGIQAPRTMQPNGSNK